MYIIIDNYDSFTYNLYQYLCEITDKQVKVIRNDAIETPGSLEKYNPEAIIISPGPGHPSEAGLSVEIIKHFSGRIPILGVCLGHQAIAHAYGATVAQAKRIVHGKVESMKIDGKGIFRNIPSPSKFTRYHSLAVMKDTLPEHFEISAMAEDGEIMGIRHLKYPIEGIQFHPESMASEYGKRLLLNFINYKRDPFSLKDLLSKIMKGEDLTRQEAENFMEELTEGNLSDAQIAALLVALNAKGPAPEEIAGCAAVLKKKRKSIQVNHPLLDTCGTGGDGLGSFNISSFAAMIAATCGAWVAKHGNKAVSSLCGSADFFREMGLPLDLSPAQSEKLLRKSGFAFLFAPYYHSAMRHAAKVRQELKIKTIMNLVGPLSNPAGAEYQLIGVYSDKLCFPVARAAKMLGVKRVMVVYGMDGMDEISVSAPTKVVEINETGEEKEYILDPRELGVNIYPEEELKGGKAQENVAIAWSILTVQEEYKAVRDAALVNAGAALYISGIVKSVKEGYNVALGELNAGHVKNKIEQILQLSQELQE